MGNFWKLQINYFPKTSLDGYFKLTSDTFLQPQGHSKVERSGGQTVGQKNGKSDLFYDFKNLGWTTKTGDGEAGCFIL